MGRKRLAALAVGALTAGLLASLTGGGPAVAADSTTTVDFSLAGGAPQYHASGTIYGMTPDGSLPQDHFYTDIKWHLMRAGGAQTPGVGGWSTSQNDFNVRWQSTLAQAKRTAALGGTFVILPHDLWGADGSNISSWPGDNGDWTNFDTFANTLISDVKNAGITVEWDLWNEPDGSNFWAPSQTQYLQMWQRFYAKVRAALPNQLIVGPSTAGQPSSGNGWWTNFLNFVKANNVAPDIWSWHDEPGDPVVDAGNANSILAAHGLTNTRAYQINEYAAPDMQNPGGSAWFIGRLERCGCDGLRGNWASGYALQDYAAALLTKNAAGQYLPLGDWWMYRFYGSMTGNIVSLTPGGGTDGLATKDTGARVAKVLLGADHTSGNETVALNRLDTANVVESGKVRVVVQRVPYNGGNAVAGPETIQDSTVAVTNNTASVVVPFASAQDGYTITILPPSNTTFATVAVAQHSGQCLDDTNLSTSAGTQLQQYPCEGGYQQTWDFTPVASGSSTYSVKNELSGLCLDVAGSSTSEGAAVVQNACASGSSSQRFTLRKVTALGSGPRDFQLVDVNSGKCVDVSGISTDPRALIHQWTCNPVSQLTPANQTWRLFGDQAGIVDDAASSAAITWSYTGSWGTASGVGDLTQGTAHWTNTGSSSAKVTFTGTALNLYGVLDADQGTATVSVDGGPTTTIDDYSSTRAASALLFSTGTLRSGTHTVTVTATGSKNASSSNRTIALDAAVALP
ncbi:RICIN domain-containing protein [Leifsonia xyli]|uniref:RICIN domain-containing protein n=1 Tax=Leifsonia xyli TaxID=1575 RepID=UPI003D67D066